MKKLTSIATLAATACLGLSEAGHAAAPPYNGGLYAQDFDTLPQQTFAAATVAGRGPHELGAAFSGVMGVDGWYGSNPGGSSANTEFKAHNGSLAGATGRGLISFGSDMNADRALGQFSTSNQVNTFGLVLQNNTVNMYKSADLSFVGEQWRRGNVTTPNVLAFDYLVSPTPASIDAAGFTAVSDLHFIAPNTQAFPTDVAIDGNSAANQVARAATIVDLEWAPGSFLVLRWTGQDIAGQDDALAIDRLNFTAQVPEPGATLAALGLGGLMALRRRR